MRYIGSKNKISKEIAPIIQSCINQNTNLYIEPFCGGANMIDKINFRDKIGSDIHPQLIALLNHVGETVDDVPDSISFEEYKSVQNNKEKYPDWYVGLVGFCASFSGKYFGGYARNSRGDNSGSWSKGAIKNLKAQAKNLNNIKFRLCSFDSYNPKEYNNCVFYCDPPYKNTTKYKTGDFPYEHFYSWVRDMSKSNVVLVSEYNMPDDFKCIWEMDVSCSIDSNKRCGTKKIEKLFIYNGEK